jgi:hypothetical protein
VSSFYLDQIRIRADEIRTKYPGWLMRIYYHIEGGDKTGQDVLCANWCQNPHLDLCNVEALPGSVADLRNLQPIGEYSYNFKV